MSLIMIKHTNQEKRKIMNSWGGYVIKPLTHQLRRSIIESLDKQLEELDSCENNSYVTLQKNTINQFKKLIKSLPVCYPIPVERRNGR